MLEFLKSKGYFSVKNLMLRKLSRLNESLYKVFVARQTEGFLKFKQGRKLMKTITYQPETASIDIQSDATWDALYHLLTPMVRNWVYHAQVPSWRGQELDVAGDILQTALRKTFEYALNAEQHGIAIASLE